MISGTLSIKAGRVFVSVLCETYLTKQKETNYNPGVGIDLGIKSLAVVSNGNSYPNINKTPKVKKIEKKLKRESRALSRKYISKKKGGEPATKCSNIRKNILRVQKLYYRLSSIRKEHMYSVVSTVVKTKPQYITIEDLNIKGMMKNRHLSKAITNQGFYAFKTLLLAQCKKHNIELRQVSRFFPSSKKCSKCGEIKSYLSLSSRVYICESCGCELDRDLNASYNLRDAKQYTILTKKS